MKVVTRVDDHFHIRFDFDWATLSAVKRIPGRRFHPRPVKHWTCPITPKAVQILQQAGFLFEDAEHKALPQAAVTQEVPAPTPVRPLDVPGLRKPLFPFQREGVGFIESRKGRALIADEMGLGKTLTAIAWLLLHPEKRPAIIVCPAHLKLHWEREIREAFPKYPKTQILFGTNTAVPLTGEIIIINYDILPNQYETYYTKTGKKRKRELPNTGWVDYLKALHPQVVIIDEAHYCRNTNTLRTKGTRKLTQGVPHVIALSGTPIVNRPIEGFSIIQMVDQTLFPSFWDYTQRYCDAKHGYFGWDFTGASNQNELYQRLTTTIMLRRLKEDVLQDLPDKVRSFVPVGLSNELEYKDAEDDFIAFVRRTKGKDAAVKAQAAEYLVRIEGLKQLAIKGKMAQAIQWIKDFLESEGKLVVFAVHKATLDALQDAFPKGTVRIDGGVSAVERDKAVRAFQRNDKVRLFLGNIQAAGTGITLTATSSVAFLELPWTSGELSQAEDRCHRIGQKNAVNIYYILAGGTIEERIAELLDGKRQVLSAILDGREADELALLSVLLNSYQKEGADAIQE